MSDEVFGPVVTRTDVESAVKATAQTWLPTYLHFLERKYEIPTGMLPEPQSWNVRPVANLWLEDQLPAVVIVSGGLAREPERDAERLYRAPWSVGVMIVVSAATPEDADFVVGIYAAAVRLLLVQNASLGGFASGVLWRDEGYASAKTESARTGQATLLEFTVSVNDVARGGRALPEPPPTPEVPPGDRPTVQTTDVQIERSDLT